MVDCIPSFCRRRGKASASLRSEQVGVTDDIGALRHFYVLDHPEGPSALRTHLRPTFPVELIIMGKDNTAHKHPSSLTVDIHSDTVTLTMNKSMIPYITFSMSQGSKPTTTIKDSYFEGDNKLLKVIGVGEKSSGCLCCQGNTSEEFALELFFATPLLRDYVESVMSGLGHQDSSAVLASKAASPVQSLKIFVGSWNFGNNPPPTNLEAWIPRGRFDLYAIGMQESPGQNIQLIINYMGDDYVSIKDEVMGVIRIIVLIRKSMVQYVQRDSVESFHVASGILGGLGINKGGVGVALRYRNTPIAFIASHLAARATAKRNRRRNKDVRTIVEKMSFGLNNVDVLHQYNVFWLGDLNYRITLPWEETVDLIRHKQWETLRKHDQLLIEKGAGRVFFGYDELPLDFPPTYKYIDFKNSTVWDPIRKGGKLLGHVCRTEAATEDSRKHAARLNIEEGDTHFLLPADTSGLRREYTRHKMQSPSWTDRILYKSLPNVVINQESVGCADEIQTSDHTPIFSTFNMRVPLPPPADIKFLKCTIHISNVSLINPRLAGEGYGGVAEDEDDGDEDDDEDEEEPGTEPPNTEGESSIDDSSVSSKTNKKVTTRKPSKGKKKGARRSVFAGIKQLSNKPQLSPVLAMHLPFLRHITKRTAYKTATNTSSVSSTASSNSTTESSIQIEKATTLDGEGEGKTFTWNQSDIPVMGPFFTKMEYLEHRHIIFRVQGNAGHGAAGNTIGYCTVSLAEMTENRKPVSFQCTLLRGGQPAGVLRGKILIKWLDGGNNVISQRGSSTNTGESKNYGRNQTPQRIQMNRNPTPEVSNPMNKKPHLPLATKKSSLHIHFGRQDSQSSGDENGHKPTRSIQMSEAEMMAGSR